MMIPEKSLLRRLPTFVEGNQRLRFEAIAFSADALDYAYERLHTITAKYGRGIGQISREDRTALFTSAWSIVDRLDAVRQLIDSLAGNEQRGAKVVALLQALETARSLRNKMDHLNQQIGNMAKAKGYRPPVFGALSYLLVEPHQLTEAPEGGHVVTSCTIMAVISGSALSDGTPMAVPNPAASEKLKVPVGAFRLTAFDKLLDVDALLEQVGWFVNEIEAEVETTVLEHAHAIAEQRGVAVESVLASKGIGEAVIMANYVFIPDNTSLLAVPTKGTDEV